MVPCFVPGFVLFIASLPVRIEAVRAQVAVSTVDSTNATVGGVTYEYQCCCLRYTRCFEDEEERIVCQQTSVKKEERIVKGDACYDNPRGYCAEYGDDYFARDAQRRKIRAHFSGDYGRGSETFQDELCRADDGWYPFTKRGSGASRETFRPIQKPGPVDDGSYERPRSYQQKQRDDLKAQKKRDVRTGKDIAFPCTMPAHNEDSPVFKYCNIPDQLVKYIEEVKLVNQKGHTFWGHFDYMIKLRCRHKLTARFTDNEPDTYSKGCKPGKTSELDYNSKGPDLQYISIDLDLD